MSWDLEHLAAGKVRMEKGKTELCFTLTKGLAEASFEILYTVRVPVVAQPVSLEAEPKREPHPQRHEHVISKKTWLTDGDDHDHDHEHEHDHDHDHLPPHHDQYDLAQWCITQANCTGIFVIQSIIECDGETHFDPNYGMCMSHTEVTARHSAGWMILPAIFVITIIIIALIACFASFHSDSDHHMD
jgi:hypothetical protein